MSRAVVLLLAAAVASSCEKRPPEPTPPPARVVSPEPRGEGSQPGAQPQATSEKQRCIQPLPDEAPRIPPPAAQCPPDPVFGGVRLPKNVVTFLKGSDGSTIEVELATTPEQQERGLMFRTRMPENEGMLFAFDGAPHVHTFWMRNTCIPLDMMFITEDGTIAGIVENAPTLNDGGRSVPCPVSYVLEVNAGFSRRHGVKPGQMVKLPKKE